MKYRFWEKAVIGLGALVLMWMLFSWVDILAHNDPFEGDEKYSPFNFVILVDKVYEATR